MNTLIGEFTRVPSQNDDLNGEKVKTGKRKTKDKGIRPKTMTG